MKLTANVRLPNAISIGKWTFAYCYALRHITLHPNVNIAKCTFHLFLSLEVLATCAGFELDTGDYDEDGDLNPTVANINYLKWRCENDRQKDVFHNYKTLIKLSNWHIDKNMGNDPRCWPVDSVSKFMLKYKDAGVISHILSFFGEKRGCGDLRNAIKERLLELGLQKKVLRQFCQCQM